MGQAIIRLTSTLTPGFGAPGKVPDKRGHKAMKRTQIGIFFLVVAFAVAAMTFAGTASAGWTWDENVAVWTDDTPSDGP